MKNVIIYSRVATPENATEKLAQQTQALKEYCKAHELNIVAEFKGIGYGFNFIRDEFYKLLSFIKQNEGKVEKIIVTNWNRFSRNLSERVRMLKSLKNYGVVVIPIVSSENIGMPEVNSVQMKSNFQREILSNENISNSKTKINSENRAVKIVLHKHFQFQSCLEIFSIHKNYAFFSTLRNILKKANKNWDWLFKSLPLSKSHWDTYLSGKEYVSLDAIEVISDLLRPFINNPKELMNETFPSLSLGKKHCLNLKVIMKKYNFKQGEVSLYTGIERGNLSNIINGKTKNLRYQTLQSLFTFFKSNGVPLKSMLDLIYFPAWGEHPMHFLESETIRSENRIRKFNSFLNKFE